jgi:hypothetical protein
MSRAGCHVRVACQIADASERRCVATPDRLKVMITRLEAFDGWPGVQRLIRRAGLSGDEVAAVLLRSRFAEVTVVFSQPPVT